MAIMCVTCTCGSVDKLVRNVLKQGNYGNWLTETIHRGKEKTKSAIKTLPKEVQENASIQALLADISHRSKFAIIIGYTDDGVAIWADVAKGGIKAKLDAQLIVEKYGNI